MNRSLPKGIERFAVLSDIIAYKKPKTNDKTLWNVSFFCVIIQTTTIKRKYTERKIR